MEDGGGMVRVRGKTVQMGRNVSEEAVPRIVQRECVSVECSDDSSGDGFNFKPEGYTLRLI